MRKDRDRLVKVCCAPQFPMRIQGAPHPAATFSDLRREAWRYSCPTPAVEEKRHTWKRNTDPNWANGRQCNAAPILAFAPMSMATSRVRATFAYRFRSVTSPRL